MIRLATTARWVLIPALAGLLFAAVPAHAEMTLEQRVKAAFLFNFAKFVQWPSSAFDSPAAPFRICVLGSGAFTEALEEAVEDKTVSDRGFQVSRIGYGSEGASCHIVFTPAASSLITSREVPQLPGRPVLTVADSGSALQDSSVVVFTLIDGKVRFEIDRTAAENAGLKISSKLLSVASGVR